MIDICAVAHITKDVNTTPAGSKEMPGGAAYYFGMALSQLATNFKLITKLSDTDHHLLSELDQVDVTAVPSAHTHFFENIYQDFSDNREQKVHSLADPFTPLDLQHTQAKIWHLGPLADQDIPISLIDSLRGRGRISLDAQGFLRRIVNHQVQPSQWQEKTQVLPKVDILKVNDFEASILTGQNDMYDAARDLASFGIKEVVITMGSRKSLIYYEDEFYEIPAYKPNKIVDATGCGDTYMAGYLFQRLNGKTIDYAGRFAAAMATLKMGKFGAFSGTPDQLENLIASDHNSIC